MLRKNGFSLVELLVSLTVVLLLTGIGVTTFSGLLRTKRLVAAKNELMSWINLSRNLAVTGQLPSKNLGLQFVKVTFDPVNFKVDGIKEDGSAEPLGFFTKVFGNDIDTSNMTIKVTNSGMEVTSFGFRKTSGRLVDGLGEFIDGPIDIVVQSEGVSQTIIINDLGIINEK